MSNIMELCMNFKQLGVSEIRIMDFLDKQPDFTFTGGYSDITRAIGRKDCEITNITKACKTLEEKGLVTIWKNPGTNGVSRATKFRLNPMWDVKLVKSNENGSVKNPPVSKLQASANTLVTSLQDVIQLFNMLGRYEAAGLVSKCIPNILNCNAIESELVSLMILVEQARDADASVVNLCLSDIIDYIKLRRTRIIVNCCGEEREWYDESEAKTFYAEAMNNSEGTERDRYADIFRQLNSGLTYCTDSTGNL